MFAYRATVREEMTAQQYPIGPENNAAPLRLANDALFDVAAWGTYEVHRGRDVEVRRMLPRLHYLRLTKDGHPAHPLYLQATLIPVPFE